MNHQAIGDASNAMDMDNTGFGNDKGKGKGKGGGKGGSGGKSDTICRDFAHNGQCRFGTQCRFRHGNGGAATDTGGSVFGSGAKGGGTFGGGYAPNSPFGGGYASNSPFGGGYASNSPCVNPMGQPQAYTPQQQAYLPQQQATAAAAGLPAAAAGLPAAAAGMGGVGDDVWSKPFEFGKIPEDPPPSALA